MIPHGVLS
ncbi:hypothetical protein LINPERPRIM_LOCUS22562 [Linum perenne]